MIWKCHNILKSYFQKSRIKTLNFTDKTKNIFSAHINKLILIKNHKRRKWLAQVH